MQPSLQTGAGTLDNSTKGSATPDQEGTRLLGAQWGGHQDAVTNEVAGVMDLPVDLADSRQSSITTAVT